MSLFFVGDHIDANEGWAANAQTPGGFRRNGSKIELFGVMDRTSLDGPHSQVMFTLPVGFRPHPSCGLRWPAVCELDPDWDDKVAGISIDPATGNVSLTGPDPGGHITGIVWLDSVSFLAA